MKGLWISGYFKWSEFNVNNTSKIVKENIELLVFNVLDLIRDRYNEPIYITCGYRSPEVNFKVGGVSNSQHLTGEACDFTGKDIKKLWRIINELIDEGELIFDQMIYYRKRRFIHVSYSASGVQRKQLLIK